MFMFKFNGTLLEMGKYNFGLITKKLLLEMH